MSQPSDDEVRFDMRRHAFVLAMPLQETGILGHSCLGTPNIIMSGGDVPTLVQALRIVADMLEKDGGKTIPMHLPTGETK